MSDFFKFETKRNRTDQIWRIRWVEQQYVAQFDQLGRGVGIDVGRCVVMVEEHFFLRQMKFLLHRFD